MKHNTTQFILPWSTLRDVDNRKYDKLFGIGSLLTNLTLHSIIFTHMSSALHSFAKEEFLRFSYTCFPKSSL